MKYILSELFCILVIFSMFADIKVGDDVNVLWKYRWQEATVLEIKGEAYFVKIKGFHSDWNFWAGPDEIEKSDSFETGTYMFPPLYDYPTIKPVGDSAWLSSYSFVTTDAHNGNSVFVYFPDGKHIIVGESGDFSGSHFEKGGAVSKWDLSSHKKIWKTQPFPATLSGNNYVGIKKLAISPDSKYIAALPTNKGVGSPHDVRILSAKTGKTIHTISVPSFTKACKGYHNGELVMLHPREVIFSSDSKSVYIFFENQYGANFGGCLVIEDRWLIKYHINEEKITWKYKVLTPAIPELKIIKNKILIPQQTIAMSPNGSVIAVGDAVGTIAIVDSSTGKENKRISSYIHLMKQYKFLGYLNGNDNHAVISMAFTDNDIIYATISGTGYKTHAVRASIKAGTFLPPLLTGINDNIANLAINKDNRLLGIGGTNFYLFDLKTKKVLFSVWPNSGWAYEFKFNPKYEEVGIVYGDRIHFIHRRPKRELFTVSGVFKNTGLFADEYTGLYVKSEQGEFEIAWGKRKITTVTYKEIFNTGFQAEAYINGDYLSIKSEFEDETRSIILYGGRTSKEADEDYIRKKLPEWGNYPDYKMNITSSIEGEDPEETEYKEVDKRASIMRKNIIEYAFSIKSEYMSAQWTSVKDSWKNQLNEGDPRKIARLVKDFGGMIDKSAFTTQWIDWNKKDQWLTDLQRVKDYIGLAHAMQLLDDHVDFKAVDSTFVKKRRKYWLEEFQYVIDYGEYDKRDNLEEQKQQMTEEQATEKLYWAINSTAWNRVKRCIDAGADVNAKYEQLGNTALMIAVAKEEYAIVKLLLQNGADVNAKSTDFQSTALMTAVCNLTDDRIKIIMILLKNGAEIDAQNINGTTALMTGAYYGQYSSIEVLLKKGATVNIRDNNGKTALWHSSENCIDLLKSFGAK